MAGCGIAHGFRHSRQAHCSFIVRLLCGWRLRRFASHATIGTRASRADHHKLRSYAAAKREIMPGVEHRQHKGLNNRLENSHQPTRRERIMKWFKSPRQVQRFLSTHDQIVNVFSRRPNQDTAAKFLIARSQAFTTWTEFIGVKMAV